jgi:hypothetical protein
MARDVTPLLLLVVASLGCSENAAPDLPADAGADTEAAVDEDAPGPLDAPAAFDAPAVADRSSAPDVTAPDAPAPVDAPVTPPPVDAPETPPPVDVPVAPPPVDVPVTPPPADVPVAPPSPPVMTCIATGARGDGGGTCSGIDQAYSARGINAGYYPFRVLRPIVQFSGDHDGDGRTVFGAGATRRGVVLQTIPAGAYVGLSTVAGNYDPPTGCDVATCGNPARAACGDSSPPLRAPVAGFYWGYAYQGASHMQGWINVPSGALEFAGYDAGHPCALGPAGADYEVRSVCGRATACRGTNPTCGAVNRCDEGDDDCGRTQCGAMSGGPLTPTAWRRTITRPGGHACTDRDPPNPAVRCLANGREADFFFVYPFGAYLYWAQNSTTRAWLHYGDRVQVYFHNRDAQGVLWDFVEVLSSGAPTLTPAGDGSGAGGGCSDTRPESCHPCRNGGTCGWVQDVFVGG